MKFEGKMSIDDATDYTRYKIRNELTFFFFFAINEDVNQ